MGNEKVETPLTDIDEANKKIEEQVAAIESLKVTNDELTKKLEQLGDGKTIVEAAKQAQQKTPPAIPSESFQVEDGNYKFIAPAFVFEKKKWTAVEAIKDSSLLARLVEKKVGFIKPA